ncbi:hypothetical protein [Cupriavidus basilensis]|nr:hypothetical protein [Cupriavidus basilensis]MDF3885512.1 hypothetical protein [Cupriavidus basilensis]
MLAETSAWKPSRAIIGALLKGLPAVADIANAGQAVVGLIGAIST